MLLGYDIGGTKCSVVIGKENARGISIAAKETLPTKGTAEEMVNGLNHDAMALLAEKELSIEQVEAVGISCGGPLDSRTGMVLSPPNLPGWDNFPIVDMVRRSFQVPVCLQNDANACAVAEWKYGAGMGYENIVFMTFGTGLGAGLILNNSLYAGAADFAGEIGHIRLEKYGPIGYGKAGSFEGFCSGGGIAQLARIKAIEIFQMGGLVGYCQSKDRLDEITAQQVAAAADRQDALALEVFKVCGEYMGRGIAMILDMLNPERVIIGGIYPKARHLLESHLHEILIKECLPQIYHSCSIVPASLGENIGDIAALSLAAFAKQTNRHK